MCVGAHMRGSMAAGFCKHEDTLSSSRRRRDGAASAAQGLPWPGGSALGSMSAGELRLGRDAGLRRTCCHARLQNCICVVSRVHAASERH
jgi:hypothetical protein